MPSADIMPPRSGTAEPENRLAAAPRRDAARRRRPVRRAVPRREVRRRCHRRLAAHVLETSLQDALDVVLEPERGAPDHGLVRRLEPVQAGLVDDLLHRACLLHRLVQGPSVGGEHRSHHGPGHRHRGHAAGEQDHHDSARDQRGPDRHQPGDRDVDAGDEGDHPGHDRQHALHGPAGNDLARLVDQPALLHDVRLELRVEQPDRRPELRQLVGCR